MRQFLQTIRYQEWFDSKWNCYLFLYLLFCLRHENQGGPFYLKGLLAIMAFTFFLLAFGYAFNDHSDAVEDRMAGKNNQISSYSPKRQAAILCSLALAGFLIPLLLFPSMGTLLSVLLSFGMAFLYSYRALGVKRRNALGLVVSSLAQRVCPLFLIFTIFNDWSLSSFLAAVWAFLVGLRWILIHQVSDFDNDRKTNTDTFVTRQNNETLLLAQITSVFLAEVLFISALLWLNSPPSWAWLIPALYAVFQLSMLSYWRKLGWKRLILSYDFAPLADFYYLWVGLFVVTCLVLRNPCWSVLYLPVLYLGYRYIVLDLKYIKLKRDAKRGMPPAAKGAA